MSDIKELILKNWTYLADNLSNISTVLRHLVADGVISLHERDIIKSKIGNDQTDELVSFLLKKDLNAQWETIKEIFKETGNNHCAKKIEAKILVRKGSSNCTDVKILPSKWWPENKPLVYAFHARKTGDKFIIENIKEQLVANDGNLKIDVCQTIVISGMPGVGKTTTAKWFGNHFSTDYDHILWIDCGEGSLLSSLQNLARDLNIRDRKELKLFDLAKNCFTALEKFKCLVIFDNAQCFIGPEGIRHCLPKASSGYHCIITSRNREWGSENGVGKFRQYFLDCFDDCDSRHFLKSILSNTEHTSKELDLLIKYLGSLPLALQIAVATIKKMSLKVSDYIDKIYKTNHIIHKNFDDYEYTVNTAMKISMDFIRKRDCEVGECAYKILESFGYLRPDDIPIEVFQSIEKSDMVEIKEGVELLEQYSLVTRKSKRGVTHHVLSIHRLLQKVIRHNGQTSKHSVLTRILSANFHLDYKLIPYTFADDALKSKFPDIAAQLNKLQLRTFLSKSRNEEAIELSKMIVTILQSPVSRYNHATCVKFNGNVHEAKKLFKKLLRELKINEDSKSADIAIYPEDFDEFGLLNGTKEPIKAIVASQLYLLCWMQNKIYKAKQIAYDHALLVKNTHESMEIILKSISEFASFKLLCSSNLIHFEASKKKNRGRYVKFEYVNFMNSDAEADSVVLNKYINLERISKLKLHCYIWKPNIKLIFNSSINLEKLSLKHVDVIQPVGNNWQVENLSVWWEINSLVNQDLDSLGYYHSALPRNLKRLTINYAKICDKIIFLLPSLTFLQLANTDSFSVSKFSLCDNLQDIYLLGCTPLDLFVVPKSVKRVKLVNTAIVPGTNAILHNLIISESNWKKVKMVIDTVKKDLNLIMNVMINCDFYKESDIEGLTQLILQGNINSLIVGNLLWENESKFQVSNFSKLVNVKANFYSFLGTCGQAIEKDYYYQRFNI